MTIIYLFEAAFRQLIPPVRVKLLNDGEELGPALEQSEVLPHLIIPLRRTVGLEHAPAEWL